MLSFIQIKSYYMVNIFIFQYILYFLMRSYRMVFDDRSKERNNTTHEVSRSHNVLLRQ